MELHQKSNKVTYWFASQFSLPRKSFLSSKFFADKSKWFRTFWAFCSTDFCNFLAKSLCDFARKLKNLSCKNPQNVLNHFHCLTKKFLAENPFWSPLTTKQANKYSLKNCRLQSYLPKQSY